MKKNAPGLLSIGVGCAIGFYKLNVNIQSFFIIADGCLSRKSVQSSEKTEDVYENEDDGIGTVLQVCGLLPLLLILSLLFSFFPSLSRGTEVKAVNRINMLQNFNLLLL